MMLCAARALFVALRRAAAGCLQCTAVGSQRFVARRYGFGAIGRAKIVKQAWIGGHQQVKHLQKHRQGPVVVPSRPLGHAWTGEKRPLFSFGFLVATASCTLAKSKLGPAQTLGTAASRNTDAQELL